MRIINRYADEFLQEFVAVKWKVWNGTVSPSCYQVLDTIALGF